MTIQRPTDSFQPAPTPPFEAQRLRDLYSLKVLDTEAEQRFDRYTQLAADLFKVPIALVSLVDEDRQWFKSATGTELRETERSISLCGHVVANNEPMVVEDAWNDQRFANNPLVQGDPPIRFYAGIPLHGTTGQPVGTLCLIDQKPATWHGASWHCCSSWQHWSRVSCSSSATSTISAWRSSVTPTSIHSLLCRTGGC